MKQISYRELITPDFYFTLKYDIHKIKNIED